MLGCALAEMFTERGYQVLGLVRSAPADKPAYRHITGDLTDAQSLALFVAQIDVCVHLAAQVSHGGRQQYKSVNIDGTQKLCDAIRSYNPACRLVNCSSIAALRFNPALPFLATPYARSKFYANRIVERYRRQFDLRTVTISPGLIYGPGDERFLPAVIRRLKQGSVTLVSGGERHAPLIYIDDLAELFFLAATDSRAVGEDYIGVRSETLGIHEFIRQLARQVGAEEPRRILPKSVVFPPALMMEWIYRLSGRGKEPPLSKRAVDILSINFKQTSGDANKRLDWQPAIGMEEGLRRYLDWARERGISA